MNNFFNNKNYYFKLFFYISFVIIISLFLYRGRLGSDDLEVFNFIFNYDHFEGSFFEYQENLAWGNKNFVDDVQLHSAYTAYHRLPWVIQTGIIYYLTKNILLLFNLENYFLIQYLSGYILTLYIVISFFLYLELLKEKGLTKKKSIFCGILIFFGTGLICLLSGQYIESMVIFLCLLYIRSSNIFYKFILALIVVLIKPFYILIIFALKVENLSSKNFYINKYNFLKIKEIYFLFFAYIVCVLQVTDLNSILNYFESQNPTKVETEYFINLFNFYFSFGSGIFFTSVIPIFLIIYGFSKNTFLKFLPIILMSGILSFWEGFHGGIPGIRYILPFLIIFTDEYVRAINKLILYKKKIIIITLFFLTVFNLPSLEFRNFAITEYENGTVNNFKPRGPATLDENNKYIYYDWPIENIKFNNLIFSNYIFINKILKNKKIYLEKSVLLTKNIYPQTGIARLIYIKRNNINVPYKKIKIFIDKVYNFLIIFYLSIIFFFLFYFSKNLKNILNSNEEN